MSRWRWCRRDTQEPGATSPDEAVAISRQQWAEAKATRSFFHAKAAYYREMREHNHFADAIAHALGEDR